jgi:choline dehydrogenase-like flavoprotein
MTEGMSASQRETLRSVCDACFPALDQPHDPDGYWGRKASDMGVDAAVESFIERQPAAVRDGLHQLLDVLTVQGFPEAGQGEREQLLHGFTAVSPEVAAGVRALQSLTLFFVCSLPDASGRNANWKAMGYPGPLGQPPAEPKPIKTFAPTRDGELLEADVCVVGSGAGGGVIAGTLAGSGLDVVVLEAGGYFNEADFNQLELWAYEHLYYRGGLPRTADGNVTVLAGWNLGGGTTVNWMNCMRTPAAIRREWALEHGLEGLDGAGFDRHLDAIWTRLQVNEECSDLNGPHQRLAEGCAKLGYSFKRVQRNVDPEHYDPEVAGFVGFGDVSGSRLGAQKTFLLDAYQAGARILVNCKARRILVDGGRAAGVEAVYDGAERALGITVRAPRVVVACGALESPALLMRSGIGGPAVGGNLHLHPVGAVSGLYEQDQRAWWGPPQSALSDQFTDLGNGGGFLIEGAQLMTGLLGGASPWTSGRSFKQELLDSARHATLIFVCRDRGSGRVTLDEAGEPLHWYPLSDEIDRATFRRGRAETIRVHEAAGAGRIRVNGQGRTYDWNRGEDLEAFLKTVDEIPYEPGEVQVFAAHATGTCRMGRDPGTSVAGPYGELHDSPGVWIGDGSALPTAPGTNPMVTIMALAHRTAEAILAR